MHAENSSGMCRCLRLAHGVSVLLAVSAAPVLRPSATDLHRYLLRLQLANLQVSLHSLVVDNRDGGIEMKACTHDGCKPARSTGCNGGCQHGTHLAAICASQCAIECCAIATAGFHLHSGTASALMSAWRLDTRLLLMSVAPATGELVGHTCSACARMHQATFRA